MSQALKSFDRPPASMRPRALALLGATIWAGELTPRLNRNYVVKGVLNLGELSLFFGASNTGKSFLTVDLAQAVESGRDWFGHRVRKGRVLYVVAEGGAGFVNRATAIDATFWVVRGAVTLAGPRADEDRNALIEVVRHLSFLHGDFTLIIVDTLARAMGDRDENAASDIGSLVSNCDIIRAATGAHVMLVHHVGKDFAKGARGHSALRAAIDTEIVLSRDEESGLITARVSKQRDGATGIEIKYRLRVVSLGEDEDGDEVTTCVVEPATLEATPSQSDEMSEAERVALRALEQLARLGEPVTMEAWRDEAIAAGVSAAKDRPGQRAGFHRARGRLEARGLVSCVGDLAQLGGADNA